MATDDESDDHFLTASDVAKRYRNEVSLGTLRNWRSMRAGPPYVKIGKSILYPRTLLAKWERERLCTNPEEPDND